MLTVRDIEGQTLYALADLADSAGPLFPFQTSDLEILLDALSFTHAAFLNLPYGVSARFTAVADRELVISPLGDTVSLVIGSGGGVSVFDLMFAVEIRDTATRLQAELADLGLALRVGAHILQPLLPGSDQPDPNVTNLEIGLGTVSLSFDSDLGIEFGADDNIALPRCRVANTGLIVHADAVRWITPYSDAIPTGISEDTGLYLENAGLELTGLNLGTAPAFKFETAFIGRHGISANMEADNLSLPGSIVDFPCMVNQVKVALVEGRLASANLSAQVSLPFSRNPLSVDVDATGVQSRGEFKISAQGDVDFGNGILIHPIGNKPVLSLQIPLNGAGSSYHFAVNGALDFPLAGQAQSLELLGTLELGLTGSTLQVIDASIDIGAPADLSLPGGITLSQAKVTLEYAQGSGFAVHLNGHLLLTDTIDLTMEATTQYDPDVSAKIDINWHLDHVKLHFGSFFAVEDGRLELQIHSQPLSGSLKLSSPNTGLFLNSGSPDFLLSIKDLQAELSFGANLLSLRLNDGRLFLPTMFGSDAHPAVVSLASSAPTSLIYDRAANMARIEGSLVCTNLYLSLPGLDQDFSLVLASAQLTVANNQPALSRVAGKLRLPRPDDSSQFINIRFQDAAWDLTGYPSGEIFLPEDVEVPLGAGFKITVVGVSSSLTSPTSLSIIKQRDLTAVKLAGDFRLSVSQDVLTDENGGAVTCNTNGSVTFTPGRLPAFGPGEFSLNASFRLGGANGLLVKNAGLQLQTGAITDLAAGAPAFTLHVAGELVFPNADSSVSIAGVFANGGFDLRSNASIQLGGGVWLHPLDAQTPVFELSSGQTQSIQIHAGFQLPCDNPTGIEAIEVSGSLDFSLKADGSLQIDSIRVMSAISGADWILPGKIRLAKAILALGYDSSTQLFAAHLGGQIVLVADNASGSLAFQAGLIASSSDPTRIDLVADVNANRLNLLDMFFLNSGTLYLEAHTAPLSGKLALANVSAGLFPLGTNPGPDQKYYLTVQNLAAALIFSADGFGLVMNSGQLSLPDLFSAADGAPAGVAITDQALRFDYSRSARSLSFSGSLLFTNFGLKFDNGDASVGAYLDTATLTFSSSQLPSLSDVAGRLQLPRPDDPHQSVDLLFEHVNWSLDGLPEGEIILGSDVALPLGGEFELVIIGKESTSDANSLQATRLSVTNGVGGNAPTFALVGSLQFKAPVSMITGQEGEQVSTAVNGATLSWQPGSMPQISAGELIITGTFHLGGGDGLIITDGRLTLRPDQVFTMIRNGSAASAFTVGLEGKVEFANQGPSISLEGAVFEFTGGSLPDSPRFHAQGFSLGANTPLLAGLPIYITEAGLHFKQDTLPLPDLLYPENVEIHLSAGVNLAMEDQSSVNGRVDGIIASIIHGVPSIELSGIGFGVDDLEVLNNSFTGEVYLGGLAHFPANLTDVYLAGKVGGKVEGAGIELLAAFKAAAAVPLGYCIDISGGPAGIPLGQTGFLLTGVSGGVSFTNQNGDPCDFTRYIQLDGQGRPVSQSAPAGGPSSLPAKRSGPGMPSTRPDLTGIPDCPGDCPPASMNILCQPHPDEERFPGRAILKFSSLDEGFLNASGLAPVLHAFDTEIQNATKTADDLAGEIAGAVVDSLGQALAALMPPAPGPFAPELQPLAHILENPVDFWKEHAKTALQTSLKIAIVQARSNSGSPPSLFTIVRDALYEGLPCPDASLQLTATLSYTGVSSFLSVTGGVNISTTDTVGILGSVNIFGVPLGKLRAFLTVTSATGGIEPSFCGDLRFVAGPLDLGTLNFLYKVPTYINELPAQLIRFGDRIGAPIVKRMVESVTGQALSDPRYLDDPHLALRTLSIEEAIAFVARLLSLPLEQFSAQDLRNVRDFLLDLLKATWNGFQPSIVMCGKVAPKVFGLPLGSDLVAVEGWVTKERIGASFDFSPLFLIAQVFPVTGLFPPGDRATFGFSLQFPLLEDLVLAGITGQINSPQDLTHYLENAFERFLNNASLTFSYQLSPLGLKLADAAARAIMPYLLDHPASPASSWIRPESRVGGMPSRADVLKTAEQSGKLADPFWGGRIAELYPDRQDLDNLQLIRDYFPHGGILGSGKIVMPLALLESPPLNTMNTILHGTDLIARLKAAFDYIMHHVLQTQEMGALTFYMPAPNPPTFAAGGRDLSPRELLESITQLNFPQGPLSAGPAYSLEVALFSGYLQGRLLGVDIGEATVELVAPSSSANGMGYFLVKAGVAQGSWLNRFVRQASLRFLVRGAPEATIEDRFTQVAQSLGFLLVQKLQDHAYQEFPEIGPLLADVQLPNLTISDDDIISSLDDLLNSVFKDALPQVALEAILQSEDLVAVPELDRWISFSGGLQLLAYSLQYEPDYQPDDLRAGAAARRQGGIVLRGAMSFGSSLGLTIPVAQAELSVMPGSDSGALPRLLGDLEIHGLQLPYNLPYLDTVRLAFDSQPEAGKPFLALNGKLPGLQFGTLSIRPLNGDLLAFGLAFVADESGMAFRTQLQIAPALVSLPMFNVDAQVKIYGATPDDPFILDTGGPWTGTLAFGPLTLREPAAGQPILQIGSGENEITAELDGTGFEWQSLIIRLSSDLQLTAFPDRPYRHTLKSSANGDSVITVRSDGTFGVNLLLGEMRYGVFRVCSATAESPLQVSLNEQGMSVSAGQLELSGIGPSLNLFTLNSFGFWRSGDFSVDAALSPLVLSGFCEINASQIQLSGGPARTSLALSGPVVTIFPNTPLARNISGNSDLTIDSNGRFSFRIDDTGVDFGALFQAHGSLEVGNEPPGGDSENLIKNDSLDHWVCVSGNWVYLANDNKAWYMGVVRNGIPRQQIGQVEFDIAPFDHILLGNGFQEAPVIYQDISLSNYSAEIKGGLLQMVFTGNVGAVSQDTAGNGKAPMMRLDFLDAWGGVILSLPLSRPIAQYDGSFTPLKARFNVPSLAVRARLSITIETARHDGTSYLFKDLALNPLVTGPYLRISDAAVSVGLVPGFGAHGQINLTAGRAGADLEINGFSLSEVIQVGAARGSLDLQVGKALQLKIVQPGVQLLGVNIAPPAEINLEIDQNGHLTSTISSDENIRLLPDLFEIHPANESGAILVILDVDPLQGSAKLHAAGSLKLLKFPPSVKFIDPMVFNRPSDREWLLDETVDPATDLLAPISGINQDIAFGVGHFATIHLGGSDQAATFKLLPSSNELKLDLHCFAWLLDFRLDVHGDISSNGDLSLNGALTNPGDGKSLFSLAGFTFNIKPTGAFVVQANMFDFNNQYFSLEVPSWQLSLNAPNFDVLPMTWPTVSFGLPGFTIRERIKKDKIDFGMLNLPSFGFKWLNFLPTQGPITLHRDGDKVVVTVQSHQDFLDTFKGDINLVIEFDGISIPKVDPGHIRGDMDVSFNMHGFGFGRLRGEVILDYHSNDNDFPFQGGGDLRYQPPDHFSLTEKKMVPSDEWNPVHYNVKFGPGGIIPTLG